MVLDLILKEMMHLLMSVPEKIQVGQLVLVQAWTRAVVRAPVMHLRENSLPSGVQTWVAMTVMLWEEPQLVG